MAKRGDECKYKFQESLMGWQKGGKIVLVNVEIVNEMAKRGNECLKLSDWTHKRCASGRYAVKSLKGMLPWAV